MPHPVLTPAVVFDSRDRLQLFQLQPLQQIAERLQKLNSAPEASRSKPVEDGEVDQTVAEQSLIPDRWRLLRSLMRLCILQPQTWRDLALWRR